MSNNRYSNRQLGMLVALRLVIGWHFLYEGLVKLVSPEWSAASYLEVSGWIFAPLFQWMAETPSVLAVVDVLNIWGLILIGLALMLGLFSRLAAVLAMVLLGLYYIANPPFIGLDFGVPTEGNYLWVNKVLVEFFACAILAFFPTGDILGLDALFKRRPQKRQTFKLSKEINTKVPEEQADVGRRQLLKGLATVPALGVFGYAFLRKTKWQSWEEQNLVDAVTSPSTKLFDPAGLQELKGQIPKGNIKDTEFSRLILGGNLLSGYAHSRDLIYVSELVKAYHNKDKIFATLLTAEKCGINTLLTNPILCTLIDEYWKRGIGKIQFISDCSGLEYDKGVYPTPFDEYIARIQRAIDYGATACYIQGETADYYMEHGEVDKLAKAMDVVRDNGVLLGIGAHRIETIEKCVEVGFEPDFWMKTLHHHDYWSAHHNEWHDNMYCFNPERTIEFMNSLPQPVIAFKTMAAGAIHPSSAFRYALANGADFICAGMYDFQMVDDANVALEALSELHAGVLKRQRPWMA